jgi:MFS family permease
MMDALQSASGTDGGGSGRQGWTPRWVLSLVSLVLVCEAVALGYSMISLGLPAIIGHFRTTQGGWLLTSYLLAGAVGAAILGKAADLFGKRRVLMFTLAVSAVGAVLCAVAPTFWLMVVGRALQGVVIACLPLAYSLIRDVFPSRLVPFAVSVSTTGVGFLSVLTPVLVGWLLVSFGFRGMFWFDAICTLLFLFAIRASTPESPLRRDSRVDVLGALLLGGGLAAVLLVISMGGTWGWTSAPSLLFGVAGVVVLGLYAGQSRRSREPVIDLRLFRSRGLLLALTAASLVGISVITSIVVPLLAMTPPEAGGTYGLGISALQYAFIETPRGLAGVVAGMVVGVVVSRFGKLRLVTVTGAGLWIVACLFLAFRNDTFAELVVASVLIGLAYGFTFAGAPNLVIAAAPAADQGSAVPGPGGAVVYLETGFRIGLFVGAGVAAVALLLALTVLRVPDAPQPAMRQPAVPAPGEDEAAVPEARTAGTAPDPAGPPRT